MKIKGIAAVIIVFCFMGSTVIAQEKESSKWHYLAEVYLMFPTMSGDVAIANLPAVEIDADAGSILSHLKMGAMFYLEATNNDWAITSDLLYMKLEQGVVPSTLVTGGDATMKETAWEVDGLKRVMPYLEVGVGGRIVSLYTGLDLETILNQRSGSLTKTWFDPVIVVRTKGTIKEKWLLQFRGDIGGFGVGSELSWQLQAYAGYRFSKLFQTTIGYRYISIDYDKGNGADRFLYDVDTYGPVVRLGFNF